MKKIIFNEEQIKYIIDNYTLNKKTTLEIAKEFNCSRSTIERNLKANGIVLKPRFPYEDLTGKSYGKLIVLNCNEERYKKDVQKTKKPHRYWTCLCECGRIIDVESSHLKSGHTTSCGCVKSKGELKITNLLIDSNINFSSEVSFNDLRGYGNGRLRFDFAILKNNKIDYLIEYNGKQHYIKTNGWCDEKEFKIRQINDKIKIDYCNMHNIPLIIIPYTHFNNIVLEDLLLETSEFVYKGENNIETLAQGSH